MLQNTKATAFAVSELLIGKQKGVKVPPTHRLGLNSVLYFCQDNSRNKSNNLIVYKLVI